MVSYRDFKILKKYSERDFDFSKAQERPHSKRVKSVDVGVVNVDSGYLAVCEACSLKAYCGLPFATYDMARGWGGKGKINLNNRIWSVPHMMQGDGFVSFRNLYGDGRFAVLSSNDKYYVETNLPTMIDHKLVTSIAEGDVEEEKGSRIFRLEGFVGVESGAMALTDPMNNQIEYLKGHKEISTVILVKPGVYVCRFINDGKYLAIRRKN